MKRKCLHRTPSTKRRFQFPSHAQRQR